MESQRRQDLKEQIDYNGLRDSSLRIISSAPELTDEQRKLIEEAADYVCKNQDITSDEVKTIGLVNAFQERMFERVAASTTKKEMREIADALQLTFPSIPGDQWIHFEDLAKEG
jgi:hypothetical protein